MKLDFKINCIFCNTLFKNTQNITVLKYKYHTRKRINKSEE